MSDDAERFEARVVRRVNGCWEWLGARTGPGYGQFSLGQRGHRIAAHRWAYEHFVGPIPEGLQIDHLCRNRGCVNPSHMEAVTSAENTRRGHATRTHCKHGHLYDVANTYRDRRGHRRCRRCARIRFGREAA